MNQFDLRPIILSQRILRPIALNKIVFAIRRIRHRSTFYCLQNARPILSPFRSIAPGPPDD